MVRKTKDGDQTTTTADRDEQTVVQGPPTQGDGTASVQDGGVASGLPATSNGGETDEPKESKTDKFRRLAPPRVQKVLDAIDVLGNLTVKSNYEWTTEQAAKIVNAIQAKLNDLSDRLTGKKSESGGFSL